jgi:hypothetical protein
MIEDGRVTPSWPDAVFLAMAMSDDGSAVCGKVTSVKSVARAHVVPVWLGCAATPASMDSYWM